MAGVSSTKAGVWSDPAVWSSGAVPTLDDDITIMHDVIMDTDTAGRSIRITAGSLVTSDARSTVFVCSIPTWTYTSDYRSPSRVDLRGVSYPRMRCSISAIHTAVGMFPPMTVPLLFDGNTDPTRSEYTMSDPGYPSQSVGLIDQVPIGTTRAGAVWLKTGIRNLSVRLRWPRSSSMAIDMILSQMANSPFPALITTVSAVMRGHIESIQYRDTTGRTYIECQIMVVEG